MDVFLLQHQEGISAVHGVFIRQCLKFLTDEEVQHVCLLDNSATRPIMCKRGSEKLMHLSGKLLWCQEMVSLKELEVKQIGTVYLTLGPNRSASKG